MNNIKLKASVAVVVAAFSVQSIAQEKQKKDTSDLKFDSIPGTVSASGALGIGADDSSIIKTPKDLTILAKVFDGKNTVGISFSPARTALAPMDLSTYDSNRWSRLWANFSLGYAQGQADVKNTKVNRRAISVETSYIWDEDDPFLAYFKALGAAKDSKDETCFIHDKPFEPEGPSAANTGPVMKAVDAELSAAADKRAEACRAAVSKLQRWNESKFWVSMATGDYDAGDGSRHSLGNTYVIGGTLGHDFSKVSSSWTLTYKAVRGAPVVDSMILASPVREHQNLVFGQVAVGSKKVQGLFQVSNARNDSPTAATRVYKHALGLDMNVSEGMWVLLRSGRQRKLDNKGDENASSFTISFSPTAKLKLF